MILHISIESYGLANKDKKMKNICDELFYDVLPLRKPNSQLGLDALCRKAIKNVVYYKTLKLNTQKAESKLKKCREYALKNYKQF